MKLEFHSEDYRKEDGQWDGSTHLYYFIHNNYLYVIEYSHESDDVEFEQYVEKCVAKNNETIVVLEGANIWATDREQGSIWAVRSK